MSQQIVEVVITPTPEQYRQMTADLAVLRENGAVSNTSAIIEAIGERANAVRRAGLKAA